MDRTLFFHFAVVNSMYCMWVLCVVVNGFILHMKAPWFESRIGYKSTLRASQAQINGNVVPGGAAVLLIHIFSFLAVVLSGNHLWVKIRMHPDFLKLEPLYVSVWRHKVAHQITQLRVCDLFNLIL